MLAILTFRTPEEALEKANNTPYGLSAGVWTDKGSKIFKMTQRACAPAWSGRIPTTSSIPSAPFGGYKEPASVARAACTACAPT